MNAWCLGCGAERPDALPGSGLTCPTCKGMFAVYLGDEAPETVAQHPLRAQDVPALLPKELG